MLGLCGQNKASISHVATKVLEATFFEVFFLTTPPANLIVQAWPCDCSNDFARASWGT